eukprot:1113355_1
MPNNKPRSRSQQGNNNSIKAISMELGDVRKDQKKTLDKETKVDHSFAITSEGPGDIVNDHNEPNAADDNEVNEPGKEDSFDACKYRRRRCSRSTISWNQRRLL